MSQRFPETVILGRTLVHYQHCPKPLEPMPCCPTVCLSLPPSLSLSIYMYISLSLPLSLSSLGLSISISISISISLYLSLSLSLFSPFLYVSLCLSLSLSPSPQYVALLVGGGEPGAQALTRLSLYLTCPPKKHWPFCCIADPASLTFRDLTGQ